MSTEPAPAQVTMTLWGVRPRQVPDAVLRMVLDRRHLRRTPGLRFAKLLGTGRGRTFTPGDADPLHWGLLTVWDDDAAAAAFETGPTARAWDRIAAERLAVRMVPLASRGAWARRAPFGQPRATVLDGGGPVAAITRARLRPTRAGSFWTAVPPVSTDLRGAEGLRLAIGIGEAPIGLQGTFSLWTDAASLVAFAYRRPPHRDVAARTDRERWYVEELFARFAVRSVEGTFAGRRP